MANFGQFSASVHAALDSPRFCHTLPAVALYDSLYIVVFGAIALYNSLYIVVFGAIALCCYPLWPDWMRAGVYYLSIAGAVFLGFIIALAICKYTYNSCYL